MSAQNKLLIDVSFLDGYLECSICLSYLMDTHLTPCGHRFCRDCITEWINRERRCPTCKGDVPNVGDLRKDHGYQSLVDLINQKRNEEEIKRFDDLVQKDVDTTGTLPASLVAIRHVLKDRLQPHMASFEDYRHQLELDYSNALGLVERDTQARLAKSTSKAESDQIEAESLTRQAKLKEELESSTSALVTAYDSFLQNNLPPVANLPVKVSVRLFHRPELAVASVTLKPNSGILPVNTALVNWSNQQKDPIITADLESSLTFYYMGPLLSSTWNSTDELKTLIAEGQAVPIAPNTLPVLQYSMKTGGQIVVEGLQLESDLPPSCFRNRYKPGDTMDYSSCKDCGGLQWICRHCSRFCHEGHALRSFIVGHKPKYGCCYCAKSGRCILRA